MIMKQKHFLDLIKQVNKNEELSHMIYLLNESNQKRKRFVVLKKEREGTQTQA